LELRIVTSRRWGSTPASTQFPPPEKELLTYLILLGSSDS
jgi:hypothetical protein